MRFGAKILRPIFSLISWSHHERIIVLIDLKMQHSATQQSCLSGQTTNRLGLQNSEKPSPFSKTEDFSQDHSRSVQNEDQNEPEQIWNSFGSNKAQGSSTPTTTVQRRTKFMLFGSQETQKEGEIATTSTGTIYKRSPVMERLGEVAEPGWGSKDMSKQNQKRFSVI